MAFRNTTYNKATGFAVGEMHGGVLVGAMNAPLILRVSEVTTTTTVFKAEVFNMVGQAFGGVATTDMFANRFLVQYLQGSQSTNVGHARYVTAFAPATGTFTTDAMPATYTAGDTLLLIPSIMFQGTDGYYLSHSILLTTGLGTETAATHETLTVTGACRIKFMALCMADITGAGNIQFGDATNTSLIIPSTTGTAIDVGEVWYSATCTVGARLTPDVFIDVMSVNGSDLGYEITSAALTAGTLQFHYFIKPMYPGSYAVLAAGTGTLS